MVRIAGIAVEGPDNGGTMFNGQPASPQQAAVVEWTRNGSGSAFVEALAGTGKTTTLIEACRQMRGSVAFAAFNRSIADEIKHKIAKVAPQVRVGTFHSFGFGAWRRANPGVQVAAEIKWRQMMDANQVPQNLRSAVGRAVSISKQSMVISLWELDDYGRWRDLIDHYDVLLKVEEAAGFDEDAVMANVIDLASKCVEWSRSVGSTLIEFDDMLWLPLVEGVPVWTNDWVIGDEAQDTNVARLLLAERMLRRDGRSLWAGDRRQAIYQFSGASSGAVDEIIKHFNCITLPLTVTFRCSHAATHMAKKWAPDLTAHEDNEPGMVMAANAGVMRSRFIGATTCGDTPAIGFETSNPQLSNQQPLGPGDAVLCRNNKPLVALAFELLRAGKGCHVEGRDIGKSLESLVTKWRGVVTTRELTIRLEDYRAREMAKYVERDAGYQVEALNDRIETLYIIMEGCDTVDQVRRRIGELFQDSSGNGSGTIMLSTIHKAKGREWQRVFVLGWGEYMPSKYARQPWQKEAERCLQYVAVTRTRRDLILTAALE